MPDLSTALAGIPLVASTSERGTLYPVPITGQRVHNLGTSKIERWNGSAWVADFFAGSQVVSNVQTYGAKGDSTTDDAAAIQLAIDAALDNGIVYFPKTLSNVYRYASQLVISHPLRFMGAGLSTQIQADLGSGAYGILVDGTINPAFDFIGFENITLMGGSGRPDLVKLLNAGEPEFNNVIMRDYRHGVTIAGTRGFSGCFRRVMVTANATGHAFFFNGYTGGGHFGFDHCSLTGQDGIFVDSTSILDTLTLHTTNFEGCSVNNISVSGTLDGLSIFGGRSEACGGTNTIQLRPTAGNTVRGVTISGGKYYRSSETNLLIIGGDAGNVDGFTLTGLNAHGYPGNLVNLNGDGQGGFVAVNYVDTITALTNAVRSGDLFLNNRNSAGAVGPQWNPPLTTATITGSRGGNAALASLLTALGAYPGAGLIIDGTTA